MEEGQEEEQGGGGGGGGALVFISNDEYDNITNVCVSIYVCIWNYLVWTFYHYLF